MKKLFSLFAAFLFVGTMWGETIVITQDSITSFTNSYAEYTWHSGSVQGKVKAYKNSGIQFNANKSNGYYLYNTIAVPGNITSIKMESSSTTARAWTPYVGTAAMNTSNYSTKGTSLGSKNVGSSSTGNWTVTGDYNYFYLAYAVSNASVITKITVTYEPGVEPSCNTLAAPANPSSTPDKTSVELSWDEVTDAVGYLVIFNDVEYNINSGTTTTKEITGLSMETEYQWTVAAKGDGTTNCELGTATAQQEVTTLDACEDNKATYTVTSTSAVSASGAPTGATATYSSTYTSKEQLTNGHSMTLTLTGYDYKIIKGVTLSMHSNGSSGAGTFNLSVGGTTVAEISTGTAFDEWFDNTSFGTGYRKVHVDMTDANVGAEQNIVITISATANSLYCQSFAICYADGVVPSIDAPTLDKASGNYLGAQTVSISDYDDDLIYFYTTDGSTPAADAQLDPTGTSQTYDNNDGISISSSCTLKVIAYNISGDASAITSATYGIYTVEHAGTSADPYSITDARTAIEAEVGTTGVYVAGIISQVDSYNSTYKSITYWISEDGSTTNQFKVFSGKGLSGADFSAVTDLSVGGEVVVYGNILKYNSDDEFDSGNQLYSIHYPASIICASSLLEIPAAGKTDVLNVTYNYIDVIDAHIKFYESNGTTEATYDWLTATINGDNNVTYTVAPNTNTEASRSAYFKVYVGEVYSGLVTVTQAKFIPDYATLPFEFDGGRADIATTNGLTYDGLDTDYASSPYLKFKTQGTYVILKINEDPSEYELSFDIKGNSFSGGTFTLQTSENGTDYTDKESYTDETEPFDGTKTISSLAENIRYFKWIYTEKVNGNVALGNIKLQVPTPPTALEDVETSVKAVKVLRNGILLIEKNGHTYNAMGQLVK